MPIYAYRCEHCGFQKDALQKVSDPPLVDCPSCGQPKLAKQLTAAGFALKGSGWYVTDFRDSGKKASSASKTEDAAKPAAATSGSDSASTSTATPAATPTATANGTPASG